MINRLRHNNYIGGWPAVLLVILLFCPPLLGYAEQYINKVVAQVLTYTLSASMMLGFSLKFRYFRIPNDAFWAYVYAYLFLLLLRLIDDYVYTGKGNFLYGSPQTVLFFYIFPILIPTIFFTFERFKPPIIKVVWCITGLLGICMMKSFISITSGNIEMTGDGRYNSGFGIFSIEYGHYAVSLILGCLYLLRRYKSKVQYYIILAPLLLLGCISVMFAGSRGPFIALIACLCFWYFATHSTKSSILIILILIIASGIIKETLYLVNDILSQNGIDSFTRILDSVFAADGLESHSSGRDSLYEIGIQRFMENPIWGNSLFIPGKIYVHNIVLEQFMALGIVGGTIFIIINIYTFVRLFKIIRTAPSYSIICLWFVQYFIFGAFSLTIIALPLYWLMLFLINNYWDSFRKVKRYDKKINRSLAIKL